MQPVKINLIVNEALKLLRASLPSTIQINNRMKSNLAVMSDPTNIHQVIMNLCTNAGHAMQENGGLLEVSLTDVDIDADFAKHHPGLNPGKFVRLTVSDTGHGMSPEVIERIFDPFFSTKKQGEGTGMGLSVVHGIVKSHGGTLTVDSTPGQGSVFKTFFPAIEPEWVSDNEPADLMVTGSERILFVDDEVFQADIAEQMLSRLGYRLTTCTSSVEALELFMQAPEKFDLVISDMTMPHMPGDVLARELISIRPDIPIIVCTGYSDRIDTDIANDIGIRELVMKPVVMKEIAQSIRRVLDEDIGQAGPTFKRG
jgi:CheY-like chemotaxis protein